MVHTASAARSAACDCPVWHLSAAGLLGATTVARGGMVWQVCSTPGITVSLTMLLRGPTRFFGKFLGTHGDYFVFETTLQNPPAEPEAQLGARLGRSCVAVILGAGGLAWASVQTRNSQQTASTSRMSLHSCLCALMSSTLHVLGSDRLGCCVLTRPRPPPPPPAAEGEVPLEWNSGANGYVYFAASSPGGALSQLPHVTPAQVKAARRIKKLLTGRLTSQVHAPTAPAPPTSPCSCAFGPQIGTEIVDHENPCVKMLC